MGNKAQNNLQNCGREKLNLSKIYNKNVEGKNKNRTKMKAINNNLLCYFSRLHEVFHYLGTPWLQCNRNRTCSSWPTAAKLSLCFHSHSFLSRLLFAPTPLVRSLIYCIALLDRISSPSFEHLTLRTAKLLLNLIPREVEKIQHNR